jgi:prepilin-type N-terminal cleavage/methylation domain-containing protein
MKWWKKTGQRGFSNVELVIVIVIIGILANVAVLRFMNTRDSARIVTATHDVFLFKEALGLYEADHGTFPGADRNAVQLLVQDLVNFDGQPYVTLPNGANFANFRYYCKSDSQSYLIEVVALDHNGTIIRGDPSRTWRVGGS